MEREFPALGFDPAPGDPVAVSAAAGSVAGHGRVFAEASGSVSRLGTGSWVGEAGDAFRGRLRDLPRDLEVAGRSHGAAARVLADYGSGLRGRQRRADELEARAAELAALRQAAAAEVNSLAGQRAPHGSAELAALQGRYQTARSRLTGLDGELQAVIAQARSLHGEHQDAAATAARQVRRAADDAPYGKPGLLKRAWRSVQGWMGEHADTLASISGVLKGVSAVLGVLSMVPGLQFLAPAALIVGGLALAVDAVVKVTTGRGSWASLALDTALSVMPWGRVAGLLHYSPAARRVLDAAGDLVHRRSLARQAKDPGVARLLDTAGDSDRTVDMLQLYGRRLRGDDSDVTRRTIQDLALAPAAYHLPVARMMRRTKSGGIYVGDGPVGELGYKLPDSTVPSSWPFGTSPGDLPGMFDPAGAALLLGTGRHGCVNLALHEFGHAADTALGYPSWGKVFKQLYWQIEEQVWFPPHMTLPNGRGRQELFAEAFAWRYDSVDRNAFMGSGAAATLLRRYFDRLEESL
jgi:hypothetical protein